VDAASCTTVSDGRAAPEDPAGERVTPLEKIPQQYRERRDYISDDEESRYEIVLRYNRVT